MIRDPRSHAAALLVTLAALVCASSSRAASGISLTWSDCPGGATASQAITWACNSDADTVRLVCSLAVPSTLTGVIGAEVVVDMQSADAIAVPDWWRIDGSGNSGCRAGMLDTAFDTLSTPACGDAWHGNAVGGNQGFAIGLPAHTSSSQARILEVAAVPSANAVTLTAGVTYCLLTMVINTARTVSSPCGGCSENACLVFNSVLIRRLPLLGDQTFTASSAPESNWAMWQGSGASCAAVPVHRTTWGAIKSLYH